MLTNTVCVRVVDDASSKPLVGPRAQDVIPTVFQVGLQPKEQGARQDVAEPSVAVLPLHLPSYELLGAAHVELSIHAKVTHQGFDPVGFRVGVVLDQVKPVVFIYVMVQNIFDVLKHVPDQPLVPVGDDEHAVGDFAVSHAGEEDNVVQVMAYGAVDSYAQGVDGVFGRHDANEQTLPHSQLCANVFSPEKKKT